MQERKIWDELKILTREIKIMQELTLNILTELKIPTRKVKIMQQRHT